ncbi:YCF48-related protein [Rhizobium laguerreae]|uniref:YCF48-related protein n=1 Tax=Rhizobium laguerreae TaxID=1076926 RepID=UPI0014429C7B|nr:YCF48-related protein [Rhizobium laguerreae]NKM27129.1 hypothetical protein [Rhizobium laguerreae]
MYTISRLLNIRFCFQSVLNSSNYYCIYFFKATILLMVALVGAAAASEVSLNGPVGFASAWKSQSGVANQANDIQMLSSDEGWAAGTADGVFHTVDGGKSWSSHSTTFDVDWSGLFFLDANHGWVAGKSDDRGVLARTVDGGRTWQRLPASNSKPLEAIAFSDAVHGWAVGNSGTVLSTNDGGAIWKKRQIGTGTDFHDLAFLGSFGLAVGDAGIVMRTEDGGVTWQQVDLGDVKEDLYSVSFTSSQIMVIAGDNSSILVTRNRGATWKKIVVSTDEIPLYSANFVDDLHGLVSGLNGSIWRTVDGGDTWTRDDSGTDATLMIAAISKDHAVAVGSNGAFLNTYDGGKHWHPDVASAGWSLYGTFCLDVSRCWIAGAQGLLLFSNDFGKSWIAGQMPNGMRQGIGQITFVDDQVAWAVGVKGLIANTKDGGNSWEKQQGGTDEVLAGASFLNSKEGWIVGQNGVLLYTSNGGESWKRLDTKTRATLFRVHALPNGKALVVGQGGLIFKYDTLNSSRIDIDSGVKTSLLSLTFVTPDRGYASGDDGVVLLTRDGGNSWTKLETGVREKLWDIAFADMRTGWAVGKSGIVLATRDGGESWARLDGKTDAEFFGIASVRDFGAIVVGTKNTIGRVSKTADGPIVTYASVADENLVGGLVKLRIATSNDTSISVPKVQFRATTSSVWKDVGSAAQDPVDGHGFTAAWSFANFDVKPQTDIRFRILVSDGYEPSAWIYLPLAYKYQPFLQWFWAKYATIIVPISIPFALFLCWILFLTTLLVIRPVALVGLGTINNLFDQGAGGGKLTAFVAFALQVLVLPWFIELPRVRKAWAEEYRAGRVSLADLSPTVRKRFLKNTEILDVWVDKHHVAVKGAFEQLSLFRSRKIYIPLPLRVNDEQDGDLIPQPDLNHFREWFNGSRSIVSIIAEGGAGKTTFALALSRYALSDSADKRLATHRMLPVILERDFSDIVIAVQQDLVRMVGPDAECDPEIVRALMTHRRLLIIADGLSERSAETQHYLCALDFTEVQANALVITSRREPQLGPLAHVAVYLSKIEYAQLIPFIFEYLNRRGLATHFTAAQQLELGKGVLNLISDDAAENTFTPLLVTLFVESALANAGAALMPERLPTSIPGIFLDYIKLLVFKNNGQNAPLPEIIKRAKMLAIIALQPDFVPTEFRVDSSNADSETMSAVIALQAAGILILRDVAGNSYFLFALDPLAEHLAALGDIERMGVDVDAWNAHIDKITQISGFPVTLEGYLIALSNCYRTYQRQLGLPAVTFPWLTPAEA